MGEHQVQQEDFILISALDSNPELQQKDLFPHTHRLNTQGGHRRLPSEAFACFPSTTSI